MNKFIITVLGKDRPGIISLISNILYELDCNLENAHQMILQQEFAGFFIVESLHSDLVSLSQSLEKKIRNTGLVVHVNTIEENKTPQENIKGETFMITTIGPDQKGLVARFSKIMAQHSANIENLKAVFKGGNDPNANIMSYQIFVTPDIDTKKLFDDLRQKARKLDLDIRIQHKNIFDAVNKI